MRSDLPAHAMQTQRRRTPLALQLQSPSINEPTARLNICLCSCVCCEHLPKERSDFLQSFLDISISIGHIVLVGLFLSLGSLFLSEV